MPGTNKTYEDIEKLYLDKVVTEGKETGSMPEDSFPNTNKKAESGKAFADSGPESAEGFNKVENDPKTQTEPSAYTKDTSQGDGNEKKKKKAVKKESAEINNSTMKEKTNKTTFDRLFEDVMGDEGFQSFQEDDLPMDDMGGEEMEGEDDLGGDKVTLELDREVAEALHGLLGEVLGGGEDELDFGGEDDVEDLPDEDGMHESHVDLKPAPDSVTALAGHNNKAGGSEVQPAGGSADAAAGGGHDDGSPKPQSDSVAKLVGKNNKVGGKVTGGNKPAFKA